LSPLFNVSRPQRAFWHLAKPFLYSLWPMWIHKASPLTQGTIRGVSSVVELLPPIATAKDFGGTWFADEEGICTTSGGADEPENSAKPIECHLK